VTCHRKRYILEHALEKHDPAIEEHLLECPECARALEELREIEGIFEEFRDAFRKSSRGWVEEGVRTSLRKSAEERQRRISRSRWAAVALAAAAVVLALLLRRVIDRTTEQQGAPERAFPARVPVVIEYRDPEGRRHVVARGTWVLPHKRYPRMQHRPVEVPPELEEQLLESMYPSLPRPIPLAHGENGEAAITL
jgi:hypothetical protein